MQGRADRGKGQALAALHLGRQLLSVCTAGNPGRRKVRYLVRHPQLLGQQHEQCKRYVSKDATGFHGGVLRNLVDKEEAARIRIILQQRCICKI